MRTTRSLCVLFVAAVLAVLTGISPAGAAESPASVYFLQGVTGTTMSVSVDGKVVAAKAPAKKIVGPVRLAAGSHTVAFTGSSAGQSATASVKVTAGSSVDVVVHRQVDPKAKPVITTYVNDLRPVAKGSGRLAVAHVAAVGPADVRVKDKVLFADIANGEVLTLTVPASTYPVEIVPTATTGPVVLGPVDLPVAPAALTRVFAIGVAAQGTMDAIVHVLPVPTRGSGSAPSSVDSGSGGQAAALIAGDDAPGSMTVGLGASAAFLALGTAAVMLLRRRRVGAVAD